MATATTNTIVTTMTAPMTIMNTATGTDMVTVTTAMPTMTETSATGTVLTTIVCLRVWPNAIVCLPDWGANWS